MKTPNTTTTSSTAKLLSKKLNANFDQQIKSGENKIYVTTKQHPHTKHPSYPLFQQPTNNRSMKNVIQTKLDIIKQQISRQISQHYKKQILKQSHSIRNISQLSSPNALTGYNNNNHSKHSSRGRVQSQKNTLIFSSSNSKIKKSHSKLNYDQSSSNNNNLFNKNNYHAVAYEDEQTLKPIRLFDQSRCFDNQAKVLAQSISKLNYNPSHPKSAISKPKSSKKKNKYLEENNKFYIDDNNDNHKQFQHHPKPQSIAISSSYRQKCLQLNQKYLNEKQSLLQVQSNFNRLKTSVEQFFTTPHEIALISMIEALGIGRRVKSGKKQMNSGNTRSNGHEVLYPYKGGHNSNNGSQHHQQQVSKIEQTARYMLECYEDIEQFKHQLQHILQLTSTTSLQQLKSLLQQNHSRHYNLTSNKNINPTTMPQSIDQFTYRFLELQASNNRLRGQYERMIEDIREKGNLAIKEVHRLEKKQKEKLKFTIRELQSSIIDKEKHYQTFLNQLSKLSQKYTLHLQQIHSNQLLLQMDKVYQQKLPQCKAIINTKFGEDEQFVEKLRKLSEFKVDDHYNGEILNCNSGGSVDSLEGLCGGEGVKFTPKYNIKYESQDYSATSNNHSPSSNNKQQPQQQSFPILNPPSLTKIASINNVLSLTSIPEQLIKVQQILFQLVYQLGSIKFQAQQNMIKLGQANEDILLLDKKMYEIRYQLEEQVKQVEKRVLEKQTIVNQKELKIKQLLTRQQEQLQQISTIQQQYQTQQQQTNYHIIQLNSQITSLNQQFQQKEIIILQLQSQLQQSKSQLFTTNKKTIELLQQNANIDEVKKEIQGFVKEECDSFIERLVKNNQRIESIIMISKQCSTLPSLSTTLHHLFVTIVNTISTYLQKSTQSHKLYIQKQKQSFQLQQKITTYQKSILSLESTLNNSILQKQQYEYLLTELRSQHQRFKRQKEVEIKQMIDSKEHQLINAHRLILQQNSLLSNQLHQQQQQTRRVNSLLQQKVNERTFYRRKASQLQNSLQQKNSQILQLQKQCNKYRMYMQELERSFEDIVKSDQLSNKKIVQLQCERVTVKEHVNKLVQVNKLLQSQNSKLRQQYNINKMQDERVRNRLCELIQSRESYQKVNIELRMKTIQLQQLNNDQQQRINKLSYELQKSNKLVNKLQRENNQLVKKQNEFASQIAQKHDYVMEQKRKCDKLWITLHEKEQLITKLMKQIENFQHLKENMLHQQQQQINIQKVTDKQYQITLQREQQLTRLTEQLNKRQQQINHQLEEIASRQQAIIHRENSFTQREVQFAHKLQQLAIKFQQYTERQAQYERKVLELQQQRQLLNEKMRRLTDKLQVIDSMERQISVRYQVEVDREEEKQNESKEEEEQSFGEINTLSKGQSQLIQHYQPAINPNINIGMPHHSRNNSQQPQPLQQQVQVQSNNLHPSKSARNNTTYHQHTDQIQQEKSPKSNLLMSPYIQCLSEEINVNDVACLHSQQKFAVERQHNYGSNRDQQWVKEINLILTSFITQQQSYSTSYNPHSHSQPPTAQKKITQLPYYDSIKLNYNKLLARLLRQPTPLQLDLSQIQCKNSISSSSSIMNNPNSKVFVGVRYNSSQNQMPLQEKQQFNHKEMMGIDVISRSNTGGHDLQADISLVAYKLKVDHLSQLKAMLYKKVQQIEKENTQLKNQLSSNEQSSLLKDKISQLQSKLYTYQDFANDQMKVGVLWNLFKQIICAYNEDDLEKFQRVCRILFKMLNYPQREVDQFNITWENRRKKNKISTFFTKWIKEGSVEKREQSARKVTPKKK